MPAPLPPVLNGPIYPVTTQVYVQNVLNGGDATVYENGAVVGTATGASGGGLWVNLTAAPTVGRQFTATQTYPAAAPPIAGVTAGVASGGSSPIPVLPVPNPLPSPVFSGWLTTCTDALLMDGLIPGCTLGVTMGATTLVNARASSTFQWFGLPGAPGLAGGAVLQARLQTGGHPLGPVTPSLPVAPPGPLTTPVITGLPLLACTTAVNFTNATPGALVKIANGASTTDAEAPWSSFGQAVPPLVAGPLTAQCYYSRCKDVKQAPAATTVVRRGRPPFPSVTYPLCTDVRQLTVTNLLGGEILTVYRSVPGQPRTVVGAQSVPGPTVTVNLPPSFQATDPGGPVSLEIAVTLCGIPSNGPGYTTVTFPAPAGGPFPPPALKPPLFDCARAVQVVGAHPGSLLQVFSNPGALARSAPTVASTADPVIQLWSPLAVGEQVYVEVHGCNAQGPSARLPVKPLPSPFPAPSIVGPVLSDASTVAVDGVLQGAQVYVFVNNEFRAHVDTNGLGTFDQPVVVPVTPPALAAGDRLSAVQALCSQVSSQKEGGGVTVVTPAPQPPEGLGDNFNYIFDSNCTNILGLVVTIDVTEEISSTAGFTIQLNAYGATGAESGWQQYAFAITSPEIQGVINNWPANPTASPPDDFVLDYFPIVALPSASLPAGYQLSIALTYDGTGNVTGANWTVDGGGTSTTVNQVNTNVGEAAGDLSPIIAFEVNLVGPGGGAGTTFTSGAGTIKCSATNVLTALAVEPGCAEALVTTGEMSNAVYGELPSTPSTSFTQTFSVT
jgi:hypothetical protein